MSNVGAVTKKRSGATGVTGAHLWLILAWAGALLLPWYGREPGSTFEISVVRPALADESWLLMVFLPLVLATVAAIKDKLASWMIVAAGAGLGLLIIDAWMLRSLGPSHAPLGWGALAYGYGWLMLGSLGLARRGWCKGDGFMVGALATVCVAIFVCVFYPVLCILVSAFKNNEGALALGDFAGKITSASIWGLDCLVADRSCGVAWNSFAQAVLVGVLTTLLGLAFALVTERMRFPFPRLLRVMSILPMITPPFVIGLALILLFGRSGMVTSLIGDWFGTRRSRWIYGMPGLTIAQLLAFTPISYMVLLGVLKGVSPSMEEASQTLRSGRWRTFRLVTWPLIRPGLANAFLIGFIESLADFGNPIMIGGNFHVLSTSIYFAVVGAAQDQGQAAVLAIVLLSFSLGAFILQRLWLGRRSYVTMGGKGDAGLPIELPKALRIVCLSVVIPWMVLTASVYLIIMLGGFLKQIGSDNTPTLEYFLTAFSIRNGDHGLFLAGSAWNSLLTTLKVALLAVVPTTALGLMTAYLLNRQRFVGRGIFEFFTMLSFAIPGTVIGISYILAFNTPPIEMTGTATIMIIAFVFRNMPVGIRAGIANLSQIDRSLDEASLTLGARTPTTLRRVLIPILRPAIATSMVYAFVRSITSVSAVIFLVSGEYNLATVYIVGRAEFGEYGIAIVYSAVLIVIMVAALLLIQGLVGERRIGRRTAREKSLPNTQVPVPA